MIFESVRVGRESEPRAGLHPGGRGRDRRCQWRLAAARPGRSAPAALAGRDWPDIGWRQPEAHGTAASSSLSRTRSSVGNTGIQVCPAVPCLVCGAHWQRPPAAAVPVRKRLPGCSLPPSDSDSEPRRRGGRAQRLARGGGRLGEIISSSSQVEVELTLAAQPAGAVQRPHSRLAAGSLPQCGLSGRAFKFTESSCQLG